MDQHSPDILPAVELPPAQSASEQGLAPLEGSLPFSEQAASQAIEQGISSGSSQLPPPPTSQALPAVPSGPAALPVNLPQSASPASMPQIADDNDLIEKEWVDRAKQIVEHTKHDPFLQNEEMTKMKVDYLKKRYNKDIKITE